MDALSQARWLVARGCSVIPLDHPDATTKTDPSNIGKAPLWRWKRYQDAPPTDGDLVAWFGTDRPRNLGIVTGAISNLVVIDCDSPEAVAWADARLPATAWRVRTSKGEHRGFRHPGVPVSNRVRIRTGDPAIKLDVRGDGGYVVGVGSKHRSGTTYQWVGEPPSIDALPVFDPAWVEPESPPEPQAPPLPTGIPDGSRNATLFREGCRLRRLGWSEGEIAKALDAVNGERCHPPFEEKVVREVAASCARYEPAEDTFPLTDTGNAEFFASVAGDTVRYDHGRRGWYVFGEHHWLPDRTEQVDRLALDAIRARQAAALKIADSALRATHQKFAIGCESRIRRDNLVELATKLEALAVTGDDWDTDAWLLGVQNGDVDLRTGQRRDGRPDSHVTKVAPVVHDPNARCPRWERFLREVFADHPEVADYLQRVFGYALTGATSEQVFWILWGLGANGKSTLMEVFMQAVLGEAYSWTMPFPTAGWSNAMSEYQRASLVGQRLVAASEVARRGELNDELIKSLTGGDTINARHPYGRPFQYVPIAKIFLRVNDKPVIRDQSHGMWRRVKLVPFTQTFGVNTKLTDELRAEAPGILAWAVRGCLDWQREGLCHPDAVNAATAEYQAESDTLTEFIDERCVVVPTAEVRAQALFDAYRSWCDARQLPDVDRLSQKAFGRRVRERYSAIEGRNVVYRGLGLLDRAESM